MGDSVRMVRLNSRAIAECEEERSPENDTTVLLTPHFGFFYALCLLISIASFLADIMMHCWLAYLFHKEGRVLYFFLTVTFIIVSSVVSTGFSMRWYIIDEDDVSSPSKPSCLKWCLRISTMLLQVAQIHRYCDALLYGLRSMVAGYRKQRIKQDSLYRKMLDEDGDAALLRLFYCVLNSAPQAVLQLTILLYRTIQRLKECTTAESFLQEDKCRDHTFAYQCLSIGLSTFSVAWSLTVYDRTVRYVREDKKRLSFFGTLLNFIFQLTWAVSRILALSVLAVLSAKLALISYLIHAALMSFWLLLKPDPNHNQCDEHVLNCMLGVAYIFVYISSHIGPQRYSYCWYYVICFAENIGCLFVWYQYMSVPQVYLYHSLILVQISAFFCSLFFLILYYNCFHPNRKCACSEKMYKMKSNWDTTPEIMKP